MSITPTSTATSAATPSKADGSAAKLADDFDSFLMLLTTQLQQQDPLSPMDSSEFTQQLVQFTSVEQDIQQNKNLENLIGLLSVQRDANAVSYIGKRVTVESSVSELKDGKADWLYELDANAPGAKLTIVDQSGKKVFEANAEDQAGLHAFNWDGKDSYGNDLPEGNYQLQLEAKSASGADVGKKIYIRDTVTELERSNGEQNLVIRGLTFPLNAVLAVSEANNAA